MFRKQSSASVNTHFQSTSNSTMSLSSHHYLEGTARLGSCWIRKFVKCHLRTKLKIYILCKARRCMQLQQAQRQQNHTCAFRIGLKWPCTICRVSLTKKYAPPKKKKIHIMIFIIQHLIPKCIFNTRYAKL